MGVGIVVVGLVALVVLVVVVTEPETGLDGRPPKSVPTELFKERTATTKAATAKP
ncbi:hypothetical protein MMIN_27760 [Mycolicibacter minnesotensis]|nr:hypothetical protein MMIN_27760 [Mycolicibacter minnesotensis]